jgi:hypothetical protein
MRLFQTHLFRDRKLNARGSVLLPLVELLAFGVLAVAIVAGIYTMQFASFYTSSKSEELIRKLDAEILALMEKRTKLQKPATRAYSET